MTTKRTTTKRTAATAQAADGLITKYAERFGIWPALLIAAGYFVFIEVIRPVMDTYDHALAEIHQSNTDLQELMKAKRLEDLEYGRQVMEHLGQIEKLLARGVEDYEKTGATDGTN